MQRSILDFQNKISTRYKYAQEVEPMRPNFITSIRLDLLSVWWLNW